MTKKLKQLNDNLFENMSKSIFNWKWYFIKFSHLLICWCLLFDLFYHSIHLPSNSMYEWMSALSLLKLPILSNHIFVWKWIWKMFVPWIHFRLVWQNRKLTIGNGIYYYIWVLLKFIFVIMIMIFKRHLNRHSAS